MISGRGITPIATASARIVKCGTSRGQLAGDAAGQTMAIEWRSVPRALMPAIRDRAAAGCMPSRPSKSRSAFRRDCDRIIHSTAFRRLKHKTQVFVFDEGDHYRTRLTHTLEVAQVARALARALGLDEDLAEALALAHDLGHPPFGHAGERALDDCLVGVRRLRPQRADACAS